MCSFGELWLEKDSLQKFLATFKNKCPVLLRNMILQFEQPGKLLGVCISTNTGIDKIQKSE